MLDADALNALLPQTQCTSCGYPDCAHYAQAIAHGEAEINLCPPGGAEGIERLALATGRPVIPLNPTHGIEGPRFLAVVDEAWCIGCTKCIDACPVDCIVGAPKQMHTVIEADCTGCELCIPACPVDCISLVPVHAEEPRPTGWAAWGDAQARQARAAYEARGARRARLKAEQEARLEAKAAHKLEHLAELTKVSDEAELARKRAVVEAAMARARARRQSPTG
jgi:electron transport complex protein RnfB